MPTHDTLALLVANGVITRDLAERAMHAPALVGASRVERLIAAGAPSSIRDTLAALTGIPVAPPEMTAWASAVHLLPSTAKKLADVLACPVQRDAQGVLHVLITEPETYDAVEKMLAGYKLWLAPDNLIRDLLQRLYGLGGGAEPGLDADDAVDIDLEASRRHAPAPAPAPSSAGIPSIDPLAPRTFADPLAPRPSGNFRRDQREEETMRIPRARGKTSPDAADITAELPAPQRDPVVATPLARPPPPRVSSELRVEASLALRAAFVRGVLVGGGVVAAVAALAIALLMLRR